MAEYGHIDILVNNAGLIRREDAIDFTEKDWDDVMNLNIKSVFFMSQAAANFLLPVATAAKLLISRLCSPSVAAFAFRLIPRRKAA